MITSKDCYLQNTCAKYLKNENCECKEADIYCPKLFRLDKLYDSALLSDTQRKRIELWLTNADECDKILFSQLNEISKNIKQFVQEGNSIYIHSATPGNGKTSWALRLMQAYFGAIWLETDVEKCCGLFINVPRFLLALKDNISEKSDYIAHIKANILDADIVIWDDIATKSSTEFEAEHLLSMIDTRINTGKCNVYTSNVQSQDLPNLLGVRLASRIVNLSTDIEFHGIDKRMLGRSK